MNINTYINDRWFFQGTNVLDRFIRDRYMDGNCTILIPATFWDEYETEMIEVTKRNSNIFTILDEESEKYSNYYANPKLFLYQLLVQHYSSTPKLKIFQAESEVEDVKPILLKDGVNLKVLDSLEPDLGTFLDKYFYLISLINYTAYQKPFEWERSEL